MKTVRLFLVPAILLLLLFPASTRAANNSEQVVFSGTGFGTFTPPEGTPTPSPFGFWIWCEADSTNPYLGQCSGAMYFYALGIVRHVVDGAISELAQGQYQISVISSKDASVSCSLINVLPVKNGPTNTVTLSCGSPAGGGQSNNAVVNVTGP
jgi:hypothetical protein